ncbi:hypothetical protein WA158_008202 [Blastocystis sp. Blastoise]
MSIFSNIKNLFDINPATLSGSMDIVTVDYEDGSMLCSPFHVRFGKDQVLSCRHKVVHISVNGKPTNARMKLGGEGEAYFVYEVKEDEIIPDDNFTSPLVSPDASPYSSPEGSPRPLADNNSPHDITLSSYKSDTTLSSTETKNTSNTNVSSNINDFNSFCANGLPSNRMPRHQSNKQEPDNVEQAIQALQLEVSSESITQSEESAVSPNSNTIPVSPIETSNETTPVSPLPTVAQIPVEKVPFGLNSDMDSTIPHTQDFRRNSFNKNNTIPTDNNNNNNNTSKEEINKEIIKDITEDHIIPHCTAINKKTKVANGKKCIKAIEVEHKNSFLIYEFSTTYWDIGFQVDFEKEDGTVMELIPYDRVPSHETTICGGLATPDAGKVIFTWDNSYSTLNKKSLEFTIYQVEGGIPSQFTVHTNTVYGKGLLDYIRFDGFLHVTFPYAYALMNTESVISFEVFNTIKDHSTPPESPANIKSNHSSPEPSPEPLQSIVLSLCRNKFHDDMPIDKKRQVILDYQISFTELHNNPELLMDKNLYIEVNGIETSLEDAQQAIIQFAEAVKQNPSLTLEGDRHYKKSLRPSPAMLTAFNLHRGKNTITFTIHGNGKKTITSYIYLWTPDTKIIISDIDGTITRSDVMGHIMYVLNRDWTQKGIAKLFSKIHDNGYAFLYLTARAVGQMKYTRDYIETIKQNGYTMPDGPIISSPDRVMASLMREVVLRQPEKFKVPALANIRTIFPSNINPFVAGFGNRPTDLFSYVQVDVPCTMVYITDKSGILTCKKGTKEIVTSYIQLYDDVDTLFPPFSTGKRQDAIEKE